MTHHGATRRRLVTLLCNAVAISSLSAQAAGGIGELPGSARAAGMGGARVDAWAGDAGLAIAVFDLMALGVSVQNIGGDFGQAAGGAHLPRRTRAGFTLNYVDPQGTLRLLTTLEGQWPAGGGSAFVVLGLESGVVTRGLGVLGRVGYVGHSGVTSAAPFTAGASVELGGGRLHLDYAYRADDALGARHRMGLRWMP